jgi:tyrosyl-tRNA synthetase
MDKQTEELLTRGVVEVIGKDQLIKKLEEGKKLRVKLGIDPTSPDLHLGRSIPLLKLRDFQKLGHQVVFIVGDFTAVIGDTSDKEAERPMLSKEEIETNKASYLEQVGKIIDLDKAEFKYNSEWLEKINYRELCEQADAFSLSDFIDRENIKKRLDEGKRVSLREVLYPLMQGYDSVVVKADVELGGTDQRFNLLAGRTLQEKYNQEPQALVMSPLVEGLDGRKMSSSWGNTIKLNADPRDMYGLVMSMKDEMVRTYFELTTRVSMNEVEDIMKGHPKEAKMRLAYEIVSMYHNDEEAKRAEEDFEKKFSKNEVPEDILTVSAGQDEKLVDIFLKHHIVSSKTEFNRLEKDGAIEEKESGVYRVGKHRFLKIVRD